MNQRSLARDLTKLRGHTPSNDGPLVSVVVTNRDGESHLRRLVDGLRDRTNYQRIEFILVDNGSKDDSIKVFERWPGEKCLVVNDENRSFSAANNQGVRESTGELVLLANNDVDPIHPDWLGFMVETLAEGVAAVGAMLVYPNRPRREHPPEHPDLTIQHLGVHFQYSQWGVRAANLGSGAPALSISTPGDHEVPAVTAACLLARRSDLLENPFDEAYWYGSEDWDLCLRLGAEGRIVIDERAVLFHHEFGTQDRFMSESWLERRTQNHQWFNDLWGPSLMRKLREESTGPEFSRFFGGSQGKTVSVSVRPDSASQTVADRIVNQARRAGWAVSDHETQASDLSIALTPPRDVQRFARRDMSVAVVVDQVAEWSESGSLDAATRIVVPDSTSLARLDAAWGSGIGAIEEGLNQPDLDLFSRLLGTAAPKNGMRIGVSTCAPDWTKAEFWGETYLARGLMRSFRRLGHEGAELILDDWRGAKAASCDAVVHLRGLQRRPVARGQWNFLWIISHPDRLEPGECDDYDIVASASQSHAEQLSNELGRQVHFLPQATDSDVFKPGPAAVDYETSVLYVGVGRRPARRGARWLLRNQRPFDLYGRNWEDFPESRYLRGSHIPNRQLSSAYRSAQIVVADHHGSMRTNGFVANRLFDVLASGGVVLSDDVAGLEPLFGDLIPTYSSASELESQIRVLLADAPLRRRLSDEGRRVVVASHTLDHRASDLLDLLYEL